MSLDLDVSALRAHRAQRKEIIAAQADRHKRIKSLIILNDRIEKVLDQLEFLMASSGGTAEQTGLLLAAPTRAGKTTALKLFLALNPPVKQGRGVVRPALFVPTPAKPLVNDLAAAMLMSLGDPDPTQGTEKERLRRIHEQVERQQVRIIIFDELQHLISRENDKVNHESADWIKQLLNDLGCGFVLAGTERVTRLFIVNDQLPLRLDDPVFEMKPFDRNSSSDVEAHRGYLANWDRAIVDCEGLKALSHLANKDFSERILLAGQGWPGFDAKLIHAASKLAILEDKPMMSLGHFDRVFDRFMLLMKRAGTNPFRGTLPRATEVWLDDEAFEIVLERYEEQRRRNLRQNQRAARL
ncbi:TniB family NTP-binding protein [Microvirga sp. HBU67558]|uniref:TniB family NTP-binding protein n=1 Tax=Microvirga TaxID=186650 RepID=UPI001B384078|nr:MULTISPECIES: TniB family NTP-binding protein [unclassified Microvirga]MBQ0822671.1 TniB family NTP-binding protein [Microvirga sp. HBU67558]